MKQSHFDIAVLQFKNIYKKKCLIYYQLERCCPADSIKCKEQKRQNNHPGNDTTQ